MGGFWGGVAAQLAPATTASLYRRTARPQQLPPEGDWRIWLVMAGRGFGKTYLGAGWLAEQATERPGDWAMIAPTFTDVRKVCCEGPSGFLAHAGDAVANYNRGTWRVTLKNGSVVHLLSADQPDRIRGYNLSGVWADEIGAWRRPEAWYDGMAPALRIGNARVVATTTPRSTRLMRDLVSRIDGTVHLTRGSTWDNAANLSEAALAEFRRWEGTTRGRQELLGELLEDIPGAAWQRPWIDRNRVDTAPAEFVRVVVGVDPTGSSDDNSDECGIVTVGMTKDGHLYVLEDASAVLSPDAWARRAARAYDTHEADRIVAEKNYGGDMVTATFKAVRADVPVKLVTATRGKTIRAEPIAALYEQGRVHHVGAFPALEDEQCTYTGEQSWSPDRMDALVWACTDLTGGGQGASWLEYLRRKADAVKAVTEPDTLEAARG